jgi:hypothetical protein
VKIAFIEYITVVLDTLYNSKVFHLLIASDMLRLCRTCPALGWDLFVLSVHK